MFGFLNLFGCVVVLPASMRKTRTCPAPIRPSIYFYFRDFFPVIVTFLRQLPFIGQFLNLPFIRPVRPVQLPAL
jgi:hypothetical protein